MKYLLLVLSAIKKISYLIGAGFGLLFMAIGVCLSANIFSPSFWQTLVISIIFILGGCYLIQLNWADLKEFLENEGKE
ncbi:hypothetical protein CL684_02425 [Candidatus Campbellbacteria bacterium]|nr:hypothetical protein [Candidatus Campbellbacteria bacterium]|tara:strand:+ start:628 stop:861 length:234 start_codon:yes stop_codon:yes gene_type:complete